MFVEGLRTESIYVTEMHRRHRREVQVEIDKYHGGPLQLVEHAIEAKCFEAREEKRGRGRRRDEIWCVFDRDEHPNFNMALELASAQGIRIATSNPCIELWFILHFTDQTAHLDRSSAQTRSKALLSCGKTLTEEAVATLADRSDAAKARALSLDAKHDGDGSPSGTNPSTSVWRLVDAIRRT